MSAMTIQQHYTQHCIHTMIFLLQMPESLCFMSMSKEKRLWSRWIYVIMEEMLEYTKKQTQERYLTDPQKINYGASTLSQIRGPGWTGRFYPRAKQGGPVRKLLHASRLGISRY